MRPKPALRTELLFYLSFLAAAALLVGVATTVVAGSIAPGEEFWMVMALVALEVGVFVVFGRHLVTRLMLRPLGQLTATADAVAAGDLDARAPDAETRDFATLAARLNRMTDHLLDARSQLVRSEKLASVGRLAAGIAHEVGNPLGAVGTYVEVLRRRGADPEVVAGLNRELDRIDQIVRGAFALLAAQGALKAVRASLDVAEGVPRVRARAYLLEQAIVNLVLNAVDAAPGAPVVVGARRWAYEPGRAAPRRATDAAPAFFSRELARRPAPAEFAAGALGALVFVADGGPGVAREDREKVFEPFYTTKPPGRGTGLGLAIVARAVHEMGGVVWIDTAREGGAAFKLFLPATGEA